MKGLLSTCLLFENYRPALCLYNLDHTSATVQVPICFLLSTGEFQLLVAAVWFFVDLPHMAHKVYAPECKLNINLKCNVCLHDYLILFGALRETRDDIAHWMKDLEQRAARILSFTL